MSRSIRQERNLDLPSKKSRNFRKARLQTIAIKQAESADLQDLLTDPNAQSPRSGPIDKLARF